MRFAGPAFLAALATSLSAAAPVPDAEPSPAPAVRYEGDRLTVTSDTASGSDVLDALRRETGADIRGGDVETGPVHQRFEQVPLRDALERYLGWPNFMLQYAEGRLRSVDLLRSAPEQPRAPAAVQAVAPSRAPATSNVTVLGRPHATWSPPAQPTAGASGATTPAPRGASAPRAGRAPAPAITQQPATGGMPCPTRLGRPWPGTALVSAGPPNMASAMRGKTLGR